MILVANFIRFLAVKNFENPLRFDKVAESFKVGTFLRHSVQFNQEATGAWMWTLQVNKRIATLASVKRNMT